MKKIMIILIVFLIALPLASLKANGEELLNEEDIPVIESEEETPVITPTDELTEEIIKILEETGYIEPYILENEIFRYIITFVVGAVGTLTLLLCFIKKLKNFKDLLSDGKVTNETLQKSINEAYEQLKSSAKMLGLETDSLEKFKTAIDKNIDGLTESVNNRIIELETQYEEIKNANSKLLALLKVFLLNNPQLVENGLVNEIRQILGD